MFKQRVLQFWWLCFHGFSGYTGQKAKHKCYNASLLSVSAGSYFQQTSCELYYPAPNSKNTHLTTS